MSATSSGSGGNIKQLCIAASKGDCETIRKLVNGGHTFDVDEHGRTALHYAANYGKTVALKLCLQLGCQLDAQDKNGCTALHRAVLDGQVDTIKVLLYEGCAVDRQDENGNTALHEAAWGGYSKIIDLLIKRGKAHVHVANKHGHKPIHLACQNGHNESTRLLLRAGTSPDSKNNNGDSPLHVSSLFGHITCTRILISAGSNINMKNKDGNTPLHLAAGLGKQKITKILLEAKCDTNLRNNSDITAVEMARRNDQAEVVLMIVSANRLWRDSSSQRKPKKNKSSKDKSKKKKGNEDDTDHAGLPPRTKGRREIKEEEVIKRQQARIKTEERILMNENYDKWRELQGTLMRQELRKQAELHGHKHGKTLTASHSDCKTCIQKLENQIEASKEKMLFELETAKARFEHKLHKMDRKMMHQAQCMDRLCQERIKAEATACSHRIDKRAVEERAHMAEENDAKLEIAKDDLRKYVEGRLRDVQKQLQKLNESKGRGLLVRSKSESDLGNLDSNEETEITDTDGEDIKGIVIGRGRQDVTDEGEESLLDIASVEENSSDNVEVSYGMLQRTRPVTRSRNVRMGKYGKPRVTIGRSKSLDREIALTTSACQEMDNWDDHDSQNDDGSIVDHKSDFKVPTYGSMSSETSRSRHGDNDSKRDRAEQRTTQNKRTSSFSRAVQHEMWAAAAANNNATTDSDGSGRSLVEGTYRPPIVVVNQPHPFSYASSDGIRPANLSSADSETETDTVSLTSSEDSLVTVSHVTPVNSSSGTLSSHHTTPIHQAPLVLQSDFRQPGSGQSESSPSTSHSSSPGDAAAAAAPKKDDIDCSKSSSGISSAASNTFSHYNDLMDDVVVRASTLGSLTPSRGIVSRNRPSGSVDIPPPRDLSSRGYSNEQYSSVPQQYVTLRSAYPTNRQPGKLQPTRQNSVPSVYSASENQRPEQLQTIQQNVDLSVHSATGNLHPDQLRTLQQNSAPSVYSASGYRQLPGQLQTNKHNYDPSIVSAPSHRSPNHTQYPQSNRHPVVQLPAFKSSKPPVAGGSAIFAARSNASPVSKKPITTSYTQGPHEQKLDPITTSYTHRQVPQEQKPVQPNNSTLPRRYNHMHGTAQTGKTHENYPVQTPCNASEGIDAKASHQYRQPQGNTRRSVIAPQNLKPFHASNKTSDFQNKNSRFAQNASASQQSSQQYDKPNNGIHQASLNRPDVTVTQTGDLCNTDSSKLSKPLAQQCPSGSRTALPQPNSRQVSLDKHSIDSNGNPIARRTDNRYRPQTPQRLSPSLSGSHDVGPQASMAKSITGQGQSSSQGSTGQRKLIRTTYEITL